MPGHARLIEALERISDMLRKQAPLGVAPYMCLYATDTLSTNIKRLLKIEMHGKT
jgi:hypothetical protein